MIRCIRRELLLATKTERMIMLGVLMNIFILALVYAGNDNLRSHLPRSLQTLVGTKEPSQSSKYQLNLDWIDKTPNLKRFVNKLSNEELAKPDRAEVIRVSLFEALIDLAVAENERGKEFPNLLKMSSVRRAISILKKLNADLNLLQTKMEAAYGLCKGCLQEKYGKKKKRLPQVICIGAKKCGTGAFQNFLAHHPHLFKPPGYDEVHFFDKEDDYAKGIEYYHSLMPETSAGEITYEKTPKYMVIPEVPGRIYAMNNTVKLIAIVCNPVNRAFSDFTHVVKSGYFKSETTKYMDLSDTDEESRLKGFEGFSEAYITKSNKIKEEQGDEKWRKWVQNVHKEQVEASILTNGLYSVHLQNWLDAGFKREQMLILNGEELISNPAKIILRAQEFMGLEPIIKESHFVFDKDKGFYCFKNLKTGEPSCLGDGKGRTRAGGGPNFSPKLKEDMVEYFKPYNAELYKIIGENFHWNEESIL